MNLGVFITKKGLRLALTVDKSTITRVGENLVYRTDVGLKVPFLALSYYGA
jgi:hypothetical protein